MVGAWWVGGPIGLPVVLAAGAAIALAAYTYAHNDLTDIEIDAVSHPARPLPSGQIGQRDARRVTLATPVLSVMLSALSRPVLGAMSIAVLLLMREYDARLKARGLAGNITVAVLASLPFLYGAWAVGRPEGAVPLVAIAMPLHFAREVAKDLDDAAGDALRRRTLPIAFGPASARAAMIASLGVFVVALTAFVVPHRTLALVILPTLALCAAGARRALAGQPGGPFLFKSAMICALISLAVVRHG